VSDVPVVPDPMSEEPPSTASSHPQGFTHFDTFIPASYELPLDLQAAVLEQGESVESWLGPVNRMGGTGVSSRYTRTGWSRRSITEHDRDAVNTLLFTSNQIIGFMLGPDDMQNLRSGPVVAVANQVLAGWQWSRDGARAKGTQFGALNANHWKDMVDALTAQPLDAALANHLNCGLPYSRIDWIEVKSRFINPGLVIHLTDGARLIYGTLGKRGQLPEVANYLKAHVKLK
jgi:hypothetical protein